MTTSNIKEAAPLIWAEVEKAKSILLHCHPAPDQDSIASALAMKLVLAGQGKKVTVIKGDSNLPPWAKFLVGGEEIVLKNYFEINISDFDLFLILDSNNTYRISKLGEINFPATLQTIVIDHHQGDGCGQINLVAPQYPATAAILGDLFKELGVELSEPVATCLMVGLHADTGGFKYPGTNSHIFNLAAELVAVAPNFGKVLNDIYGLKSLSTIRLMGHVFSTAEILLDGKVMLGVISQEDLKQLGVGKDSIYNTGLSSMLRDIEGVKISALLTEEEPGVIKVSTRSVDGEVYDLTKLLASFGGGGHKAAAGATVNKPLAEAKADLLIALESLLK